MTKQISIIEELQDWGIEGPIRGICADAFGKFAKAEFDFSNSEYFNIFTDFIMNKDRLYEMRKLEPLLAKTFRISKEELEDVYKALNVSLNIYATYKVLPYIYKDMVKAIDRLDNIARAAKRLQKLLPEGDDVLLGLLDLAIIGEKGLKGSGEVKDYFKSLDIILSDLIKTKDALTQTQLGRLFGLGSPKRKGDLGLKLWMHHLYIIWTGYLGRSVDYDGPNGVSGRSRFINFCYYILIEFDPNAKYHSIENLYRSDPTCKFGL